MLMLFQAAGCTKVDSRGRCPTPGADSGKIRHRRISPGLLFLLLALISIPIRLIHLTEPFVGEHEFRQTQTALSVWEIREHGFSVLHPKLPLFGPPWECPLEYPVFQLAAAVVDWAAPWHNLDVSIRLTSLIFYYLTALALFLLVRLLFEAPSLAVFAAAVFLFSPFNVFWSRASLVEYAATFFALAFLVCFIRWISKSDWWLFGLALCLGVLGCLTKITTFAVPLFIGGTITGSYLLHLVPAIAKRRASSPSRTVVPSGFDNVPSSHAGLKLLHVSLMSCLLIVPVAVGYAYVRYSDGIKSASPFTAWLASDAPSMKHWNYGTLDQRLDPGNWWEIFLRMGNTVMPSLGLALAVGLFALPFRVRGFEKLPGHNLLVGAAFSLSSLAVVFTFFNLYRVHTYYFIAIAPILAMCTGIGLDIVFNFTRSRFLQPLFLLLLAGLWLRGLAPQIAWASEPANPDRRVDYLREAARFIPKGDPVIVVSPEGDWSGFAPYYLKRRAFMAEFAFKPVDARLFTDTDYFKVNGFRWLLVRNPAEPSPYPASAIIKRWKARIVPVPFPNAPYVLFHLGDE